MIRSPRWLLVTSVFLALFFVGSGLGLLLGPTETVLGLYALTPADASSAALLGAFSSAFVTAQIRNIVTGAFIGIFAFLDARAALLLWALRLCVELGDMLHALAAGAFANLPVIAAVVAVEVVVLVLGARHLRRLPAA